VSRGARDTWESLTRARILPVLRASTEQDARQAADRLLGQGLRVIEVTMTTPGAVALIRDLAGTPGVLAGAGTVLTEGQAEASLAAGARFLVSAANPAFLVPYGARNDLLVVPGAATPHEVWIAWSAGAPAVKVFPITRLGGPAYLKDLRGPFPDIRLMVSGGVRPADVEALLAAGCDIAGVNATALLS
jgi:2-dehydro-3-deoxyphosphogluconate aldolase / (4S)-4-hydroxy-2-oxoglutarate aldolase